MRREPSSLLVAARRPGARRRRLRLVGRQRAGRRRSLRRRCAASSARCPAMPALQGAAPDPSWEQLGSGLDIPPADSEASTALHDLRRRPGEPEAVARSSPTRTRASRSRPTPTGSTGTWTSCRAPTSPEALRLERRPRTGGTSGRRRAPTTLAASRRGPARLRAANRTHLREQPYAADRAAGRAASSSRP